MYDDIEPYILTIDWKKRLSQEIPVIREQISTLNKERTVKILDIGCGPGFHLQTLAIQLPENEYVGLDVDEKVIDYANQQAIQKNLDINYIWGDLMTNTHLIPGFFDIIFSLGNTLPLAWGNLYSTDEIFNRISNLMRDRGVLIFQILNPENPREGYVISNVVKNKYDAQLFTMKRFEYDKSMHEQKVEFVTMKKLETSNKFNYTVNHKSWSLISIDGIIKSLHENKLQQINLWQDYNKTSFNRLNSDSLVCICRKALTMI